MRNKLQVFGLAVFVLISSHAFSQAVDAHTVTALVYPSKRCDPVRIARINIGTQTLVPGVPDTVHGDDWINRLSVTLRNTSNKTLVFASVDVSLPETGNGTKDSPAGALQMRAGINPEPLRYFANGRPVDISWEQPIHVVPGQEIVLRPLYRNGYRALLAQKNMTLSDIHKIRISITIVSFSDGTAWNDSFMAQEKSNPKKYRRITAKQFYAIPGGHTCGQHL